VDWPAGAAGQRWHVAGVCGTEQDRFLRLPPMFWTSGYDAKLDMPGLAMLLAIAHKKPWSRFPAKKVEQRYGWSEETTLRGIKTFLDLTRLSYLCRERFPGQADGADFFGCRLVRAR
jgi:hypothetical protein